MVDDGEGNIAVVPSRARRYSGVSRVDRDARPPPRRRTQRQVGSGLGRAVAHARRLRRDGNAADEEMRCGSSGTGENGRLRGGRSRSRSTSPACSRPESDGRRRLPLALGVEPARGRREDEIVAAADAAALAARSGLTLAVSNEVGLGSCPMIASVARTATCSVESTRSGPMRRTRCSWSRARAATGSGHERPYWSRPSLRCAEPDAAAGARSSAARPKTKPRGSLGGLERLAVRSRASSARPRRRSAHRSWSCAPPTTASRPRASAPTRRR